MIKPVSYATILDDPNWPALLAEYAAECSMPELGPPNPQRDLYELLEKSGGFQAFGVYDGNNLAGFACVLIYVLPHFGVKVATTESIFLSRSYPSPLTGMNLLNYLQEYALNNECRAFLYSAPVGSRFDRLLTLFDSHRHTNNIYLKPL